MLRVSQKWRSIYTDILENINIKHYNNMNSRSTTLEFAAENDEVFWLDRKEAAKPFSL